MRIQNTIEPQIDHPFNNLVIYGWYPWMCLLLHAKLANDFTSTVYLYFGSSR
jgi:hypothetical protein